MTDDSTQDSAFTGRRTDRPRIRPADIADAVVIAEIHLASRASTMPYLPPQQRSLEEVAWWVENIVLTEGQAWVAVDDSGEVLGYAALEGDMLEQLYLRPEALRRGVGSALLSEVRRNSPDGLSLHVFQANTGARAFYERHGFTVLDTDDGSRNMENLPDLTMRWIPGPGRGTSTG
ncbi:GNAT family N-acetyltransferase [Streptomyces sp. H39-S7]|uniref:GNAT family N-acetyltransferase n=1 Tax=Streptomyces sp. H39-S7 TaxID=3004357 RepID=UPI0022B037DA|nr:GNAT family N-acetyltransferase [Streptomyces sp. H39-S7]MCZ4121541.1 GNAT family N-acetyltransferase [Streptomyces sp. H39-S7]